MLRSPKSIIFSNLEEFKSRFLLKDWEILFLCAKLRQFCFCVDFKNDLFTTWRALDLPQYGNFRWISELKKAWRGCLLCQFIIYYYLLFHCQFYFCQVGITCWNLRCGEIDRLGNYRQFQFHKLPVYQHMNLSEGKLYLCVKYTLRAFDDFKNKQKVHEVMFFDIYKYVYFDWKCTHVKKITFGQNKRYRRCPLLSFASSNSSQS